MIRKKNKKKNKKNGETHQKVWRKWRGWWRALNRWARTYKTGDCAGNVAADVEERAEIVRAYRHPPTNTFPKQNHFFSGIHGGNVETHTGTSHRVSATKSPRQYQTFVFKRSVDVNKIVRNVGKGIE